MAVLNFPNNPSVNDIYSGYKWDGYSWKVIPNTSDNETDPVVGAINGIVKADGAGNISAASAGTDYAVGNHTHTGTYEPANANIQNHISSTSNPHSVTKTQVGLSNVPNTDATNPANITQDTTHRFVTDTEKSTWSGKQDALGYTAENTTNKETTALDTSTTKYPCNNVVKTAVDGKVTANAGITGATKTKITYDAKGLVTGGANATASDVGLGNVTNDAQIAKSIGTTQGDIIYFTGNATPTRLGKGTAGQVLTMNSGATAPEWANSASDEIVHNAKSFVYTDGLATTTGSATTQFDGFNNRYYLKTGTTTGSYAKYIQGWDLYFSSSNYKKIVFSVPIWLLALGNSSKASITFGTTIDYDVNGIVIVSYHQGCGIRWIGNGSNIAASVLNYNSSSNITETTVTYAPGISSKKLFHIIYNIGSNMKFYLDNTLVATHTTNLPSFGDAARFLIGVTNVTSASNNELLANTPSLTILR